MSESALWCLPRKVSVLLTTFECYRFEEMNPPMTKNMSIIDIHMKLTMLDQQLLFNLVAKFQKHAL